MSSSPSRRAVLLGLMAAGTASSLAACSGETASFSGGSGSGSGDGGDGDNQSVRIAVVAGWDEGVAATYLWKELLEQHGYTSSIQELDVASTFTGVANGQLDIYLDAWLPVTHEVYWQRYESKLEVLSSWSDGVNLLAVPDYVNVRTIAELKGRSGDFGGRIVGIEAGAGLMKATRESAIPKYGLDDFDLVEGSSPAMLAALDTAIKRQQDIVVTLWQPHWAFSRYKIRALEDPMGAYGKPDQMQVVATKGFSAAKPDAAAWLKNFKLTAEQLSDLMLKIQQAGKGNEQATAKQWISANAQVVDAWFSGTGA